MNIIGRVTKDAQVRTLSNSKQVVNFSVAINDSYRNQSERTYRADNLLRLCLLD
jgi:single-strand DNA-binding protein